MKAVYPIIIHPTEAGEAGHYIEIPDINRGTQGESLADCLEMARDALCLWAVTEMDEGRTVPEPSDLASIEAPEGSIVTLIDVDFDEYRRSISNRAIRKNCTIPSWLNEAAEKQGINFSAVLQRALIEQLGVNGCL